MALNGSKVPTRDAPAESGRPPITLPQALTPAATVLYHPELELLDAMLSSLDRAGRRIYIFVNSPLDRAVEDRLTGLANAVAIRSSTNVGLGAALNAILERAASDGFQNVLLLDQDSTPAPDLPEQLNQHFLKRDTPADPLAMVGPLLVPPAGHHYLPVRYAWRRKRDGAVDFLPTSGSLLSIAAWKRVGPFRADYIIAGIDVEWGFRAWSRGYASLVARDIQMVHRWGTPSDDEHPNKPQILRHSDQRIYYYLRNSVDCLKLAHIPFVWKVKNSIRLTAQIGALLYDRRLQAQTRHVIASALVAGAKKKMGHIEDNLEGFTG